MTVRILLDGPNRPIRPRLARFLAAPAGLLLIGIGVVGICGLIAMAYLFISLQFATVEGVTTAEAALGVVVSAVAVLAGLGLGLHLLRGRRRPVLFLRRFGFDDATRVVSFAATRAFGRTWRLVTLDDEKVKAVGGPEAQRRLTVVTVVLAPLVLLIFVVWWVAGVPALLLATTYVFSKRADRVQTVEIQSQQDVRDRSQTIMRRASRIFAPRLVVATVANPLWQQAVRSFAGIAAAVIVDVSVPSESLRWEINALLPIMGRRCVLVGRLDLLTAQGQDGRTVFASPLERDIDGQDVLAYRPDESGVRHFSRALKATIEVRMREPAGSVGAKPA